MALKKGAFLKYKKVHFSKKKRKHYDTTNYILTVSDNHVDQEIMLQKAIALRLFKPHISAKKMYPFFKTMDMFNVYVDLFKIHSHREHTTKKLKVAKNLLNEIKKKNLKNIKH